MTTQELNEKLLKHLKKAREKHPFFTHGSIDLAMVALMEEVGEAAQVVYDRNRLHQWRYYLEDELLDVMAVCVRILLGEVDKTDKIHKK